MEFDFSKYAQYLPAELEVFSALKYFLLFAAACLLLGVIGRIALGKRSDLNHSISSAMGILFIYALTVVIYTFKPWEFDRFLTPLPFVNFSDNYLVVLPIRNTEITNACTHILAMVIIAFLMNLMDTFVPKGKNILGWYLNKFIGVILAMGLHYLVNWLFNTFLPGTLVTYAPMILLSILGFMLLLGIAKAVLGLVLTIANPLLGGIYTIFFANKIGKQLSKAVLTTVILCILVYLLEHFGYTLVCIAEDALMAYIPIMAVLLILWYLIGHVL